MSEKEFEIRKDGKPYMQAAESELEPLDTLLILEAYPYIQEAMDGENYELNNLMCMIFGEIVFENKVVGFSTYDIRNNLEMIMTECYILPEFRGKRLFFDEICKMHFAAPRFGIMQPTRNVIELLLNYAFAKYATDDIVVSAIDLYLDPFDVKSDKGDEFLSLQVPPSNFYDAGICSTLFVHDGEVFYHDLLENDKRRGIMRKKLDKGYFSNIKELFSKNREEYGELIVELKDELPDNRLGYDVIVGYGDGLSDYMQGMVESDVISYDNAVSIKTQLIKEYDAGLIDDSNIKDRFNVLSSSQEVTIKNFDELKELVDSDQLDDPVGIFKDLVTLVGDNNQLANEVFNALVKGNEVELQRLLLNYLENDEILGIENLNSLEDEDSLSVEFLDSLEDDFEDEESYRKSVREILKNKYRLKDSTYIQDSDYTLETFRVLESLEYGDNYYDALNDEYIEALESPEAVTKFLSDSKFIKKDGIIEVDWFEKAPKCPNPYLRKILRDNNLESEGEKEQLIKRLAENNVTLGDSYKITSKGRNYLNEFSWIAFYEEFFNEFDFNDYQKYLDSHEGNIKDVSLRYVNEHLKLARKNRDEYYIDECEYVKNELLEEADEFLSDLNNPE